MSSTTTAICIMLTSSLDPLVLPPLICARIEPSTSAVSAIKVLAHSMRTKANSESQCSSTCSPATVWSCATQTCRVSRSTLAMVTSTTGPLSCCAGSPPWRRRKRRSLSHERDLLQRVCVIAKLVRYTIILNKSILRNRDSLSLGYFVDKHSVLPLESVESGRVSNFLVS